MTITFNDNNYGKCDVLVRVYQNQKSVYEEKEQIAAEILVRPGSGVEGAKACAWLPRGAAAFIAEELAKFKDKDVVVNVSNELVDNIGILTACRENFNTSLQRELRMAKVISGTQSDVAAIIC